MAVVTIRQLLESGVHFGHQTRRWNPKMKRFILIERSGSYIIDLQQSLAYIDKTYDFVRETVAHGGTILFVGTKKQAQQAIAEQATRVGQPYVNQRWLGGLLTNFSTVSKRLARMKELEDLDFEGTTSGFTKKELLIKKRELDKLHKSLGGIRNLSKTPSALWVVDTKKEHLAIDEAKKLGIPVIGILDTNCDPDEVQYPIPGNDDAIRSVTLLTRIVADAAAEGLIQRHQKPEEGAEPAEPLAEWEQELYTSVEDGAVRTVEREHRRPVAFIDRLTEKRVAALQEHLGLQFWHLNDPVEWVIASRMLYVDDDNPVVLRATRTREDPSSLAIEVMWPGEPPSDAVWSELISKVSALQRDSRIVGRRNARTVAVVDRSRDKLPPL